MYSWRDISQPRQSRQNRQTRQNMSDTERDAQLMTNYIDLMTNVLNSSAQVTESFNVSMRRILENSNSLFNNYYQWGRDTNSNGIENLSTTTSRRRNRRPRRNTTNIRQNTIPSTTTSTTIFDNPDSTSTDTTFNWNSSDRSWADIVRNPDTRSRNRRSNLRNERQSPISTNTTNRIIRPSGNLTGGRTNLQTFINNTLHSAFRNYTLSREQINSVLTTTPWRDIQSSSDQTVCPITQIPFQEDEMVSRITRCGHIFSTNAINNYLLNYDNRCPVCRLNLNNITTPSTDNSFTSTTTPFTETNNNRTTQTVQNSTANQESNTNQESITNRNTETSLSDELNNAVNLASTAFVNELTNNLTNNLFGSENTPSQISAEYSLFLPTNTTNTTTTTLPPATTFNWSFTPSTNATTNATTTTNIPPPSHSPPPTVPPPTTETTQSPESDASRYVTTYVEQQNPETKEEIEEPEVDTDADTDVENDGEEKIEERTNRK